MAKMPAVDYSQFRLRKINDPEYAHMKLLISWPLYFLAFILTERWIPYDRCSVIYSKLDAVIPFCEYFLIPYVLWYGLVAGSLVYFMLYRIKSFQYLQKYIIILEIVAITVYILFPNRQDLRPAQFTRDNFFTQAVKLLYRVDTSTNVCPSMHVAFSVAIASVWTKEENVSRTVKTAIVILAVLVCLSTVFLKQHSVVDGYAAIVVCLLAEWIVFRKTAEK